MLRDEPKQTLEQVLREWYRDCVMTVQARLNSSSSVSALNDRESIYKYGNKYKLISEAELTDIKRAIDTCDESLYSYDKQRIPGQLGTSIAMGVRSGIGVDTQYLLPMSVFDTLECEAIVFSVLGDLMFKEAMFVMEIADNEAVLNETVHSIRRFKDEVLFPSLKNIIEIHLSSKYSLPTPNSTIFTAANVDTMLADITTAQPPVSDQPISHEPVKPFPGLTCISKKTGGANVGDEYTGVYKGIIDGKERLCLIKQDWLKNRLRIEKIISEALAGQMLNRIYPEEMNVPRERFADVRLICDAIPHLNVNDAEKHTYIQSIYIKGYIDDLWKYAYRIKFRNEYFIKLLSYPHSFSIKDKNLLLKYYLDSINMLVAKLCSASDMNLPDNILKQLKEQLQVYTEGLRFVEKEINIDKWVSVHFIRLSQNEKDIFIAEMAEARIYEMQRPSGAYLNVFSGPDARKVVSDTILENQQLIDDFSNLAAPRLLLGDFGLHNANFGVATIDGHDRLVSLDYGASFLNLIGDLNPFITSKTGITGVIDSLYKNHFLEYDVRIIGSESMATALLKLGDMSDYNLNRYIRESVSSVTNNFGVSALQDFCKRINMQLDPSQESTKESIIEHINLFLMDRLNLRKLALKQVGYNLLLENAYDYAKGVVNFEKLAKFAANNKGLINHIMSGGFEDAVLVRGGDPSIKKLMFLAAVRFEKIDELLNHSIDLTLSKEPEKLFDFGTENAAVESIKEVNKLKKTSTDNSHFLLYAQLSSDLTSDPEARLSVIAKAMLQYDQAIDVCIKMQKTNPDDEYIQIATANKIQELIQWRQSQYLDIWRILEKDPSLSEKISAHLSHILTHSRRGAKDPEAILLTRIQKAEAERLIDLPRRGQKQTVLRQQGIFSSLPSSSNSSSSSSASSSNPEPVGKKPTK